MTAHYNHESISMLLQSQAPCCLASKGWQSHPTKPYSVHALETPSEQKTLSAHSEGAVVCDDGPNPAQCPQRCEEASFSWVNEPRLS